MRFQSTRPHGARHGNTLDHILVFLVSIHAPARGATDASIRAIHSVIVSIHAPARGATFVRPSYDCHRYGFNPRARTGRDMSRSMLVDARHCMVSIHAPARGATRTLIASSDQHACGFNPRARMGRDLRPFSRRRLIRLVSIHAPARGATLQSSESMPVKSCVSIHAPAWGATMSIEIM